MQLKAVHRLTISRFLSARAENSGLTKQLASSTFLRNLALMYDALQEIVDLSESLQCNNMSLPRAHRLILRPLDVFMGRKEAGGECETIAAKATEEGLGLYHGISLKP